MRIIKMTLLKRFFGCEDEGYVFRVKVFCKRSEGNDLAAKISEMVK